MEVGLWGEIALRPLTHGSRVNYTLMWWMFCTIFVPTTSPENCCWNINNFFFRLIQKFMAIVDYYFHGGFMGVWGNFVGVHGVPCERWRIISNELFGDQSWNTFCSSKLHVILTDSTFHGVLWCLISVLCLQESYGIPLIRCPKQVAPRVAISFNLDSQCN